MTLEELNDLLKRPTVTVPEAGAALGLASRDAAYTAAQRGQIKTLKFGLARRPRYRVPTSWLKAQLGIEDVA